MLVLVIDGVSFVFSILRIFFFMCLFFKINWVYLLFVFVIDLIRWCEMVFLMLRVNILIGELFLVLLLMVLMIDFVSCLVFYIILLVSRKICVGML